jgi:hypothetical protein
MTPTTRSMTPIDQRIGTPSISPRMRQITPSVIIQTSFSFVDAYPVRPKLCRSGQGRLAPRCQQAGLCSAGRLTPPGAGRIARGGSQGRSGAVAAATADAFRGVPPPSGGGSRGRNPLGGFLPCGKSGRCRTRSALQIRRIPAPRYAPGVAPSEHVRSVTARRSTSRSRPLGRRAARACTRPT